MVFRKQLGTALSPFANSHSSISFFSPDWLSDTPYSNLPDAIVHVLQKRIENQIVALGLEQLALIICVTRSSETDSPASFPTYSEP